MTRALASNSVLAPFELYLKQSGKSPKRIAVHLRTVRRFLDHVGETRLDRISEEMARSFFAGKGKSTVEGCSGIISEYLIFAAARLPAVIKERGSEAVPAPAAPSKKELALRQRWSLEKLTEQKRIDDDLIAKLAGKIIAHYLYFQGRMKGEPENLDDVYRFADECRELIESNLALFMGLSAGGRNVHSKIDERVQR